MKKTNLIILTVLLVGVIVGGIAIFNSNQVSGNNKITYTKCCTNIEVQQGDTLWDYAKEYALDTQDYRDYIAEVKALNNIIDDNIRQGDNIVIIYYVENN